MKKLEFPVIRNKFKYELIKRRGNWALIEQHNLLYPEAPIKYEVWRIRTKKAQELFGKKYERREIEPPATKWGEEGWTYFELADARHDYNEKVSNLPQGKVDLGAISEKRYQSKGKRKTRLFVSADS